MRPSKISSDIVNLVTGAAVGLLLAVSNAQALEEAAQIKLGENEFMSSCAACHGADARGTGPVAEVLSAEPPDLTAIAKDFNGQFPEEHIYKIIDGRTMINPHGDRHMPVWGFRYMSEAGKRASEVPHDVDAQALVFGRITSLIRYLESIQD